MDPKTAQTCPQCMSSGLHPRARKCRHCGSSLERPLPLKHRAMISAIYLLGGLISFALIYFFLMHQKDQMLCNISSAASQAC